MRAAASSTATTPTGALARDADKFERMLEFGAALPRIRARVKARSRRARRLARRGATTVLATIVRLLDTTLVRVGNDEYARSNGSFGLTTLRNRHAGARQPAAPALSRQERRRARGRARRSARRPGRAALPGDARPGAVPVRGRGRRRRARSAPPTSTTTCARRPAPTSPPRTSAPGTARVHALELWAEQCAAEPTCRRTANQLLGEVATRLGNTVAVCRKSYVHPQRPGDARARSPTPRRWPRLSPARRAGLVAAERRLLAFLATA